MHRVCVATSELQTVRPKASVAIKPRKNGRKIKWLVKISQYFQRLTSYKTVTLITYSRRHVVVPAGGRQTVALGGIMLRSTVFLSAIGAASILALSCFPASADEAADVQALKEEVAALQKKLNVLEKSEEVDRAQQQAAIQSYEKLTDGTDGPVWKPFGMKITFGGFVARKACTGTRTKIPPSDRVSKQSRLTTPSRRTLTSCAAPHSKAGSRYSPRGPSMTTKYAGYIEFDFLGAAPTANSNESNSYTPRMRQFYGTYDNTRDGWHFLAGQSWSLVTMFKEGLIPRKENVPLTIDAQYVPGFDWLRNPEIRIVKDFDKVVWLGVEAASPQAATGGRQRGPACVDKHIPVHLAIGPHSELCTGLHAGFHREEAVDPGWGHYEIFGLARGFRDRIRPTSGRQSQASNQEAYGFSGGGGAILPIWGDKLQLQGNVLYGQGVGRYDSAQLADFTTNAQGSVEPLTGFSIMAGLTSHNAVKDLDVYAYAGEEHVFSHSSARAHPSGTAIRISLTIQVVMYLDQQTVTVPVSSTMFGRSREGSGIASTMAKGQSGMGHARSFTVDTTPVDQGSNVNPKRADSVNTSMNVAMMSFRFYPKYGTLIGTKP